MLRTTASISLIFIILDLSGALSQLNEGVTTDTGNGNIAPEKTAAPGTRTRRDLVQARNQTLTNEYSSRSLVQRPPGDTQPSYRAAAPENKDPPIILSFGNGYKAKEPPKEDEEDDILDQKSFKSKSVLPDGNLTKGAGSSKKSPNEKVDLSDAESVLTFVNDSENPKGPKLPRRKKKYRSDGTPMIPHPYRAKGRGFGSMGDPSETDSTSDAPTDTDEEDQENSRNNKASKRSKNKRRKMIRWWKKLVFDPEFMRELDSDSKSGSSESKKVIWMERKGNGSQSVLIVPQKVYDIDYNVFRGGNSQRNIYHTNLPPNADGGSLRIVQSPVQINKDHMGKDRRDGPRWLSSDYSDSDSNEGPRKSKSVKKSRNKKFPTDDQVESNSRLGRTVVEEPVEVPEKLSDILKARQKVKLESENSTSTNSTTISTQPGLKQSGTTGQTLTPAVSLTTTSTTSTTETPAKSQRGETKLKPNEANNEEENGSGRGISRLLTPMTNNNNAAGIPNTVLGNLGDILGQI